MPIIRSIALVLALVLPASAFAHGNGDKHLMGTVKAANATTLTVETADKKEVRVTIDEKTKFEKGGAAATAKDLSIGERVVVHATMKSGSKEPVAQLVKFGAAAPAPDTKTDSPHHH